MKAKVKFIYGGIIIAIIAMIICSIAFKVNIKKSITELSPEDKRMMQYEQLTPEKEAVENCDNVKFSAYFAKDINNDGYAEKVLGTCKETNNVDTLRISVNVQSGGYLKDGVISINGKNFNYMTEIPKDSIIKENYVSKNTKKIELNNINSGTEMTIRGNISCVLTQIEHYSVSDNKVTLTGVYVDDEGNETSRNKEIN